MKTALLIHPRFYLYGGGELLCLYVAKALQDKGYHTILACDRYSPEEVETMFGLGNIMRKCEHLPLPMFKPLLPRFMVYQRLRFVNRLRVEGYYRKCDPDVVFSTQSSIYFMPSKPLYHFVYDMEDLQVVKPQTNMMHKLPYYLAMRRYRSLLDRPEPNRVFIALSQRILEQLRDKGWNNSWLMHPPVPRRFNPKPKKNRIVMVTRVVPQKRLEEFQEIARLLPEYSFMIVARKSPVHPGYWEALFSKNPENVTVINTPIASRPDLLEEARVYLYTSKEPGYPIAVTEGMMAGCVPVVASDAGGEEVVRETGVGCVYNTPSNAAHLIRLIMKNGNIPGYMEEVSRSADSFDAERFVEQVQGLVK